jgi:hypothetical protein
LLPESLAERERQWVKRGPHAEWPESVGIPGAVVGVYVVTSLDMRERRSGTCCLRMTVPWWRSLGVVGVCSVLCFGVAQRW